MGNGEDKELICMSRGHGLRWENDGGRGWWRGVKGRKRWDNYNSIISKIYLKIYNKYFNSKK